MKKFFVFIMFLSITTVSFAQFTIGIKSGYNTSLGFDKNWNFDSQRGSISKDLSNGFNIGLMTRFGGRVYAQIEALYDLQYSNYSMDEQNIRVKHQTFDLPVLFGFKIVDLRNFNWRLMVGPTFAFDLGSKGEYSSDEYKAEFKPVQYGLDCGTGFDIWRFTLDLRYKLMSEGYNMVFNGKRLNKSPLNAFEVSLGFKFYDSSRKRR